MTAQASPEIKKRVLNAFSGIQGTPGPKKARWEASPQIQGLVNQLDRTPAWTAVRSLLHPRRAKYETVYLGNQYLPPETLDDVLALLVDQGDSHTLPALADYRAQLTCAGEGSTRDIYEFLTTLMEQGVLGHEDRVAGYCRHCHEVEENPSFGEQGTCPTCGNRPWILSSVPVPSDVEEMLRWNHHLELYTKKCLEDLAIKVVRADQNGTRAATSIDWRVRSKKIEIDLIAVVRSNVVYVECKTGRLKRNDIEGKRDEFGTIHALLRELMDEPKPRAAHVFISADSVDPSINKANPKEAFFAGDDLPHLTERLGDFLGSLP